ncbi:hypothetical protein G6F58_013206 [Rhizopus delemar]|nr:hypothetical protein G6F58_013206 [Rhizopus delemar]
MGAVVGAGHPLARRPPARLRRAVAADVPRQRPGHQARADPGGRGLGPSAAVAGGTRPGRRPPVAPAHGQPGPRQPGRHRDLSGAPHRPAFGARGTRAGGRPARQIGSAQV